MNARDTNAAPAEKDGRTRRGDAPRVVDLADPARGDDPNGFEGRRLGVGVSIIVVDAPPGGDPKLHRHPYEEVFVNLGGSIEVTVDGETRVLEGGSIAVVPAGAWHGFKNRSEDAALMVGIHPAATKVQEERGSDLLP